MCSHSGIEKDTEGCGADGGVFNAVCVSLWVRIGTFQEIAEHVSKLGLKFVPGNVHACLLHDNAQVDRARSALAVPHARAHFLPVSLVTWRALHESTVTPPVRFERVPQLVPVIPT